MGGMGIGTFTAISVLYPNHYISLPDSLNGTSRLTCRPAIGERSVALGDNYLRAEYACVRASRRGPYPKLGTGWI